MTDPVSGTRIFDAAYWVGSKFGPMGKAIVCTLFRDQCTEYLLHKLPEYIAYEVPKLALETTSAVAFWGSKKVYNACSTFLPADPVELQKLYDLITQQIDQLSLRTTSWATGKTIHQITEDQKVSMAMDIAPFKAVDLIGPALFLSLCSNKALGNLADVLHHTKLLITNKRLISTAFQAKSLNSNSTAIVEKTRAYTTAMLVKTTLMESAFTGLWGAGAYFTYNGIYNAILEASGNDATHALSIARVVLAASLFGPTIYDWVAETVYPPVDTSRKKSDIASHLAYTDLERLDLDTIPNDISDLTHEERMARLAKFRIPTELFPKELQDKLDEEIEV